MVYPTELDKSSMTFDACADMKRIGGPIALAAAQQEVTVQVYVDHSAVEVFLSSGEALATRQAASTMCSMHAEASVQPTACWQPFQWPDA